jgi:hypothetical protein
MKPLLIVSMVLTFCGVAFAQAIAPANPAADPGGFLTQLLSFAHTAWSIAVMLGVWGALEIVCLLGRNVPKLAWLDHGRTTLIIGGAISVLGAALDVLLNGGAVQSALIAAVSALLAYWHPAGVAKQSQAGSARLSVLLVLALTGCALFSSSKGKAGEQAAAVCVVEDVAKYAAEVEADLSKADFEAALATLKTQSNLSQDAINCVIRTILAVIDASKITGQASPVVVNGYTYLAAHGGAL